MEWDGRDAAGNVVPDEAFYIKIHFSSEGGEEVYDPSLSFVPTVQSLPGCSYSRSDGVLEYTIPWPARVHVQAGQSVPGAGSKASSGPVLRTIVDREPRATGSVVERWNGLDSNGTIFVPDLPHFAVGISLERLPENALITVGNRQEAFFDYVQRVRSVTTRPAVRFGGKRAEQTGRLSACGRQTPQLSVEAEAAWNQDTRSYELGNAALEALLTLDPQRAPEFLSLQAELQVFLDETLVLVQSAAKSPARIVLGRDRLQPGKHRVAFDWVAGPGRIAASAIQVDVMPTKPVRSPGGPNPGETR